MYPLILLAVSQTPDPSVRPAISDDQIGPGFPGFLAMAFIVLIMFFLIRDMVKRIRRVRYRAQVEDGVGSHGPKAGYVDIPIMSDEAVRAAGAAVEENSRPSASRTAVKNHDGDAPDASNTSGSPDSSTRD